MLICSHYCFGTLKGAKFRQAKIAGVSGGILKSTESSKVRTVNVQSNYRLLVINEFY